MRRDAQDRDAAPTPAGTNRQAWKTCPTGARHRSFGRAQYKPGITVTPCDPEGSDAAHSSWLWGCESLEVAMGRGGGLYHGNPALFDIWLLEIPAGVRVEGFPQSGGRGYLRFKSCVVIDRVFGTAPLIYAPVQFPTPSEMRIEKAAVLRADAVRRGVRARPDDGTAYPVDRRVLEILDGEP